MFIDTHCHLYVNEFESDRDEVLQRAVDAGVERFYLPAIDRESGSSMLDLADKYPDRCIPMIGLHPCSVKSAYTDELSYVEQMLHGRKFAAIGEIGLDYYWDKQFINEQKIAFEHQITLANKYSLPIVIHTREAMRDTFDLVKTNPVDRKGIFHCFGGSVEEAKQIIELGFYLGIGGVLTYKKAGLSEVLPHLPLESMVLETDAPYLTPVPNRGKRNESSYIPIIARELSRVMKVSIEEIAEVTSANAKKIFAI